MKEFTNEPILDYSDKSNYRKQVKALESVRANFGKTYPNIVNGKKVKAQETIASVNPADPSEIIGVFQKD